VVAPHSQLSIDEEQFAPYEVVGELGARPIPLYVARPTVGGAGAVPLVVAERFEGACRAGDAAGAELRREARRISTLANPNLARVREVAVRGDDLVVFGDFLDGEKLAFFWDSREWLPIEIALRVLLDVLTGVAALHTLRDASQQPMKLIHGEIAPSTVLFGVDGVGRLLHSVTRRAPDARADDSSLPYLAPEVHAGDARDGRADVFSAGVLLWEALAGKLLSGPGDEPAGLRVRSNPLPAPSTPEKAPWAKALVPVVAKALAADPEDRWLTAAAMASEIRKASGLKLAAGSAASAYAKNKFGDRVKERRARWEGATPAPRSETRASSRPAAVVAPPVSELSEPVRPAGGSASAAVDLPVSTLEIPIRGEEFSSSVLESFHPPPPPASVGIPDLSSFSARVTDINPLPPAESEAESSDDVASFSSDVGPLSFSDLEDAPSTVRATSSAESPVPLEAPVVFEEEQAGPIVAPFGNAPELKSEAPGAPAASKARRRPLVLGAVAAAGLALAVVLGVRATHREAPVAMPATTEPATAPPRVDTPVVPEAPSVTPPPDTASAASSAKPVASAAPKSKGPKTKGAGVGAAHSKSGGVRPPAHAKAGAT
jgi:hypothetical protein